MRSTFKTIVFTSLALSLAAGGAFAAGPHEHHRYPVHDDFFYDDGPQPFLEITPAQTMPVQAMPVQMMPDMVRKPRLERILAGVRSAEWQIQRDARMHRLSAGAARRLDGEANSIRHRALTVAGTHNGSIPNGPFQLLKGDLRKLDRDIVRMS